jgi:hypothetical protein
LAQLKI